MSSPYLDLPLRSEAEVMAATQAPLSPLEREVLQHVADRGCSAYDADPGSPDDLAWLSLVGRGFATGPCRGQGYPGNFYYITSAGLARLRSAS